MPTLSFKELPIRVKTSDSLTPMRISEFVSGRVGVAQQGFIRDSDQYMLQLARTIVPLRFDLIPGKTLFLSGVVIHTCNQEAEVGRWRILGQPESHASCRQAWLWSSSWELTFWNTTSRQRDTGNVFWNLKAHLNQARTSNKSRVHFWSGLIICKSSGYLESVQQLPLDW